MGGSAVGVLGYLIPIAVTALVCWIAVRRTRVEPRRLSNAFWLLAGCGLLINCLAGLGVPGAGSVVALLLTIIILAPVLIITLAIFLILNGVALLRRERVSPAHLLSLLAGLGLLALVVISIPILLGGVTVLIGLWAVVVLAVGYLAVGFFAFVGYSLLYPRLVRNHPADWVVVLGSGLGAGGRVTPLLASRIRTGLQEFARRGAGTLVLSGGRGDDEPISEAEAMAAWALENGAQQQVLQLEDRSRNTEQNLRYSRALVRRSGGPGLIVTSNYHAMRAALLARKLGIDAQAAGAPTAGYYWPSAMIREYIAILLERPVLHLILIAAVSLPGPVTFTLVSILT